MPLGSIINVPFPLPGFADVADDLTEFSEIDRQIIQFAGLRAWITAANGNYESVGSATRVWGPLGVTAFTSENAITVGPDTVDGRASIFMPGGITGANELPLHVRDVEITGDYTIFVALRWATDMVTSGTAYQIIHAGIDGGQDCELYMLNNALYHRHGTLQNATSGNRFTAGGRFLVGMTYSSAADRGQMFINSPVPHVLQAEGLSGLPEGGRPLVIGGKLNALGNAGSMLFKGAVHDVYVFDRHMYGDEMASVRETFFGLLAQKYPGVIA
ncbi:hypothetical protein [Sphingobium abikonense]|uniref:hypothetical protein n=1 Tax=Sphingobium abikonense TaxID=86193 RepID=UPI0007876397|nr:hypothetical protein [Sphingobium abikonense]